MKKITTSGSTMRKKSVALGFLTALALWLPLASHAQGPFPGGTASFTRNIVLTEQADLVNSYLLTSRRVYVEAVTVRFGR